MPLCHFTQFTFSSLCRFNEDWGIDQRRLKPTQGASDGHTLVAPELGIEDTKLGKVPAASTKIDLEWRVKFQERTVSRRL
jgi:hypothetical protein